MAQKRKANTAATRSNNFENRKGTPSSACINQQLTSEEAVFQRQPDELEIHWDNECERFQADAEALTELSEMIPNWVSVGIYLDVRDLMRGLDTRLAKKMARYIGDFCWGVGRTITGIDWLDSQLLELYNRIYEEAKASGKELGMPIPF